VSGHPIIIIIIIIIIKQRFQEHAREIRAVLFLQQNIFSDGSKSHTRALEAKHSSEVMQLIS